MRFGPYEKRDKTRASASAPVDRPPGPGCSPSLARAHSGNPRGSQVPPFRARRRRAPNQTTATSYTADARRSHLTAISRDPFRDPSFSLTQYRPVQLPLRAQRVLCVNVLGVRFGAGLLSRLLYSIAVSCPESHVPTELLFSPDSVASPPFHMSSPMHARNIFMSPWSHPMVAIRGTYDIPQVTIRLCSSDRRADGPLRYSGYLLLPSSICLWMGSVKSNSVPTAPLCQC